jgi:hypothetical protein
MLERDTGQAKDRPATVMSDWSGVQRIKVGAAAAAPRAGRAPLSSHRNDERLVLGTTGVDHEGFHGRTCLIAGEMRNIARDDRGFTQLDGRGTASFDFDDQIAVERVQHFLGAGMHMPGRRDARTEFDNADDRFLHLLVLAFHVLLQNLRELRPSRSLRKDNPRSGWYRNQYAGGLQQFSTDECHDIPPRFGAIGRARLVNTRGRSKFHAHDELNASRHGRFDAAQFGKVVRVLQLRRTMAAAATGRRVSSARIQ